MPGWRPLCIVVGLVLTTSAQAQDGGATVEIAAPHYGDVLFHHYQDHDFAALTALMTSQHYSRLGPHDAQAELLRGGLLLSYGLHDDAARVFAQLLQTQATPAVRNQAWFHLARARQRLGLLDEAEQALAQLQLQPALPRGLDIERRLLAAQIRSERGDPAGAAALLQPVTGDDTPARYARYNLAVALLQQSDAAQHARATAVLDALSRLPATDSEQRGLRDRANLARGQAALRDSQPEAAHAALQRVRLQGLHSNAALLGYGWAAMERNDAALALQAWTELAQRPEVDAAVIEARLAVPYAHAETGALATALQGYERAVSDFEGDQLALQQASLSLREAPFFDRLLQHATRTPDDAALGSFDGLRSLPDVPHAAPLLPLLASHPLHEGLKNLNDLQFADRNTQRWLRDLVSFDDMLDNRRIAFGERLPPLLARSGSAALAAVENQLTALAAELAKADEDGDGLAYADTAQLALLQRVERAQQALQQLAHADADVRTEAGMDDTQAASARDRLRLAEGTLRWQLARAQPERAWAARKALRDAQLQLAQAREREAELLAAQQREPQRLAGYGQRIAELRTRLQALLPQVQALAGEQKLQLQAQLQDQVQAQQQRLQELTAQARYAIAQLQDRAQQNPRAVAAGQVDGARQEAR